METKVDGLEKQLTTAEKEKLRMKQVQLVKCLKLMQQNDTSKNIFTMLHTYVFVFM